MFRDGLCQQKLHTRVHEPQNGELLCCLEIGELLGGPQAPLQTDPCAPALVLSAQTPVGFIYELAFLFAC